MKKITTTISFKSALTDIKDISERNKVFHALDVETQRKEIAYDMLNLVLNNVIHTSYGWYWDNKLKCDLCDEAKDGKELQLLFNQPGKINGCQVCQRGGIMLSLIRLGNSINPDDPYRHMGSVDNQSIFSRENMRDMESEFENGCCEHPYECNTDEKLANICCNIIVNGEFNIEDDTDYLVTEERNADKRM